jgi:hypothetical protein
MISDAFVRLAGLIVHLLVSGFPDLPDPAGIIGQSSSAWGQVLGYMRGVSGWFPFGFAFTCLALVGLLGGAAGGVKLVRIVASFVSGGGGSAA